MSEHIIQEREGAVVILSIDRQRQKNALTVEMYDALTRYLDEANADPSVRAIILTGKGADFSSGNDLVDFLENPPRDMDSPVFRFINATRLSPKPILAAVEGLAIGIGTTILLHCDLVYAAENTRFKMPFVDLGVTPEAGSSYLLPANFGYQRAAELLMLCPIFDAKTAQEAGFVTRITEPGKALETAKNVAAQVAAKAPLALQRAKKLMKGEGETLSERMAKEAVAFGEGLQGSEFKEAVTAFQEKRQPKFD